MEDAITPKPTGRRGRRWWAVAVVSIVVLGLGAFALLLGGVGGSDGSLNAIAAAAVRTQEEPGTRAAMHVIVSSPKTGTFTMTGHMVSNAEERSRGVLTMPPSDSHDSMKLEMVMDGDFMYLRSSRFGTLPGGREWMGLDLSFGHGQEDPLPAGGDPKGELAILEAMTGGVQKLGRANVRGVPTTHYRGTTSISERAEELRDDGEDGLASRIEEEDAPLQVEAWIDAKGLIRRMRIVRAQAQGGGGESQTTDMRIDFIDFGVDPEIDVPASDEVFDATDLAHEELESPSD